MSEQKTFAEEVQELHDAWMRLIEPFVQILTRMGEWVTRGIEWVIERITEG
jgi:hypothetical protein